MKRGIIMRSRSIMRLLSMVTICTWLPTAAAWGAAVPPPDLLPLNQIPVPEPLNLFQFVKNKPAAIKLGKAFFWDMQVGSDGVQACASCHFHAGADNRMTNTVNPGTRGGDTTFQVRGPNETLLPADFPFHLRQEPDLAASPILRDSNDVVGSQGVHFTDFLAVVPGSAVDSGIPVPDPVFQAGGVNARRVTARNTPSVINAVFNFNNFWDGRAHFLFNGVNPFGPLDPNAGVWFNENGSLIKRPVAIQFASLASQATGPPVDDVEMSFRGRTFPDIGRKMLSLVPLGKQLVHPGDSVLGPLSRAVVQQDGKLGGANGLSTSYAQMIRDAFHDNLWNSNLTTPDGFTQMEANFSLFWGLAIQLYEATLVSDQTPFDRFLGGDRNALTDQQQDGFNLFNGAGGCTACHISTEMSDASVRNAFFITNADHALIEPMSVANGQQKIYDNGYLNTAVRPTGDDIGRGGSAPFINRFTGSPVPLSFCDLAELQALGNLDFNPNLFLPGQPRTPVLPAQIPATFPVANPGSFKTPGLRNVELTAPYFHNGGDMTLEEVVDFYTRGGNFPDANAANVDAAFQDIGALVNAPDKMAALVAFMNSMTDERVRIKSAPFDHPELLIPNGEDFIRLAARDSSGTEAPSIGLTISPVTTPTNRTTQLISGTKESGATIEVVVNGGSPQPPDVSSDTTWSTTITGLISGDNTISVTATDPSNGTNTLTVIITVNTALPTLTLNPVTTPTAGTAQTISGTVTAGLIPLVSVDTGATVGPVTVSGTAWSAQISGLVKGANFIVVAAVDNAGNFVSRTATIIVSVADGNFKGTGTADISDALKALRIAVGLITPTSDDMLHGDVAPLDTVTGMPIGNNKIDVADALTILRKVVGLIVF